MTGEDARTPDQNRDRRQVLRGQGSDRRDPARAPRAEIASVLVQARPERLDDVEKAISEVAGCEIHARDRKGKLVVVIEAPDAGVIGATLNTLALLPNVLSATLVFHATDAAAATASTE